MGRFKKFVLFVGLMSFAGLMGFKPPELSGAEITLRYAGNMPMTHHVTRGMDLFAKLVGERSKGRVQVIVYPAGQLFTDKDMMKAVPSGAVDMAEVNSNMWTGLVPTLLLPSLQLFYKDRAHYHRAMDGEAGGIWKADLEGLGVKLLHWLDYGTSDFGTKIPLKKLEDFKGKRIRASGEMELEFIKAYGAAPVHMGGGEVYMALQRGTIDGAISGVSSFWERKYYEVVKYVTHANAFATFPVLINLKKWNTLPPDIQKIIMDCSMEVQEWGRKESEKVDKEATEKIKEKGMEVYVLPAEEIKRWGEAGKPAIDIYLKRAGEKGRRAMEAAEKVR